MHNTVINYNYIRETVIKISNKHKTREAFKKTNYDERNHQQMNCYSVSLY